MVAATLPLEGTVIIYVKVEKPPKMTTNCHFVVLLSTLIFLLARFLYLTFLSSIEYLL